MQQIQGIAVGAALAAGLYGAMQVLKGAPPELGLPAEYLVQFPDVQHRVAAFRCLGNDQAYERLVQTADLFCYHALHFQRSSQFQCNRLITQMKILCYHMCNVAAQTAPDAAYLRHDVVPELESICVDVLHNLVLGFRENESSQ